MPADPETPSDRSDIQNSVGFTILAETLLLNFLNQNCYRPQSAGEVGASHYVGKIQDLSIISQHVCETLFVGALEQSDSFGAFSLS